MRKRIPEGGLLFEHPGGSVRVKSWDGLLTYKQITRELGVDMRTVVRNARLGLFPILKHGDDFVAPASVIRQIGARKVEDFDLREFLTLHEAARRLDAGEVAKLFTAGKVSWAAKRGWGILLRKSDLEGVAAKPFSIVTKRHARGILNLGAQTLERLIERGLLSREREGVFLSEVDALAKNKVVLGYSVPKGAMRLDAYAAYIFMPEKEVAELIRKGQLR
ncbi:hypothetical protein COX86_00835 [Candidatus Micrarchaeota archaeon CG_4_10_14_0_2_um_filter_60_11]|nr:MAG: hypothetical protein AUJ16_00560 [Candidatus Micrarchaeota archaeon CG1_02_60_51]PIN95976.1 MAG: hypothetical protein COU39_03140 [Candidatus Micrarchaeota archaeon CG10_big_fil_rev_8_21_14_0_10_60_32]PIO02170.1 MAG: hypothetical protein COT58_01415 [Candidatus Micrarchaeota archaeon CG09_land_8_20_14_0_10_60_16]PIY91452.1 MAG: hypothetical protein COY71_03065 [Candidatus Micrarchaeota archaeon CG_4_10_14_0_8_um_filter_60_7]PIZ91219.1 MAG: hypothetical protein COX86_00835 [Candidatus Mi